MKTIFLLVVIMLTVLASFSGTFYWLFAKALSSGWTYVIDHGSLLIVALTAQVIIWCRSLRKNQIKKIIKAERLYLAIVIALGTVAHVAILGYYFFAEDSSSILYSIKQNFYGSPFNNINNGYPFAPFVFAYLLFQTWALPINVLALFYFLGLIVIFYCLLLILSEDRLLTSSAVIFFATTPSFLDTFSWQANAAGMPLVLGLYLWSLILLIRFQQKRNWYDLPLSLIYFAVALKLGFVRVAGLILLPFFLIWWPLPKIKFNFIVRLGTSLTYFLIWEGFILTRLSSGGFWPAVKNLFLKPSLLPTSGVNSGNYLLSLTYYVSHLFIPADLAKFLILHLQPILKSSVIIFCGSLIGLGFALIGLWAIWKRKTLCGWLGLLALVFIVSGIFYVPLFGTVPRDISRFDLYFVRETPPYGPGSRYVFSAALGVAILFGLSVRLVKNQLSNKLFYTVLLGGVIVANVYFTNKGQLQIIRSISIPERSLIGKFFNMVPRDGQVKLVFSTNPQKNVIDNNVTGWHWLWGFYKENELTYTNDLSEAQRLVATGQFAQNNFYAFYVNPETNAFANVSTLARQELLKVGLNEKYNLRFVNDDAESGFRENRLDLPWIFERPLLVSQPINYLFLRPRRFKAQIEISNDIKIRLPFSDVIIENEFTVFPSELWWTLRENMPMIVKDRTSFPQNIYFDYFDNQPVKDMPISQSLSVINLFKLRENLRQGIEVWSSSLNEIDSRAKTTALIDGEFASDPSPGQWEDFYQAGTTPTTIVIKLPYPVVLGRLLLNTPKSMINDYSPTKLTVFASSNGKFYQLVGSLDDEVNESWSPNNGRLRSIPLLPLRAVYLKIIIEETTHNPVVFDEIIVDPQEALAFKPAQIHEILAKSLWHLPNKSILEALKGLSSLHSLVMFYACAQESDWWRQAQTNKIVPGIWRMKQIKYSSFATIVNLDESLECNGSILRKIVIVGPPVPVKLKIKETVLE